MDLFGALEYTPLFKQVGYMFLYFALPVLIGLILFRKLPKYIFALLMIVVVLGGIAVYLKFGLLNADAWGW